MFAFFAIIESMQKAQLEPTAFAADECQQIGGSFSANKRGAIFLIIRPSKPDDAPQVAPLIDIVFTEMEIPQLMKVPKKTLYSVLEQAFLLPTYRYGYPQMLVADQDGQIEGIAVGYLHEQEAHIDDALKPLLPKLGLTPNFIAFFRHRNLCRRVVFRYASSRRDSAGTWDRDQIIKRSRYGCSGSAR